ncbi:MAG: hypothetical protein H0V44_12435 [Planctomycetes bacterium]|nr:hypothetical protein [Planctomycetota bacterium]
MLDFRTTKKGPVPAFSLDKRDHLRRQTMRKREWRAVIMLPLAIGVVVYFVMHLLEQYHAASAQPKIQDATFTPMSQPILANAPPLPSESAIVAMTEGARELMKNPQGVYLHIGETDPITLAWMREQLALDAKSPPVPQRFTARELVGGNIHAGVPALVSGRIEDSISAVPDGADEGYQRLLLALDEQQFAEVLAPPEAANLIIGHNVQVVGRFLGHDQLPSASGVTVKVPLIAARVVSEDADVSQDLGVPREWQSGGEWRLPDDLFADLSDERTVIETRPYYYLLGQVKLDLTSPDVYADAIDGNARANDIHQDPDAFRNKPVRFVATVLRAWEDPDVAKDQPFGVGRCIRILAYHSDFGPITETIDGEAKTRSKIVQRMFEFAITGSQPIPEPRTQLSVTGRFLKFHAIPVKENQARDRAHKLQRQSDKVYAYFLIAHSYGAAPPPPPAGQTRTEFVVGMSIAATVLVLLTVFYFQMRKENRAADHMQVQVRKLRETRRGLRGKILPATGDVPAVAPDASAASTPAAPGAPAAATPETPSAGDVDHPPA